ncbi:hypothetical protein [Streptomyces sp. NBC_01237]|uniref:hypothetical protein n=1 Tax=Streptomyces sp. NBC_01237 TaxID=2903790 RepID=UPI002DDC5964|nr:hypothetical protein [Streptomyces sp. NBC_01237]WRZ77667.1 hypothetical protein OG251_39305 [Streptomyces sp. NBC_01237]
MSAVLSRVLSVRAHAADESDGMYVPPPPSNEGGLIDFLTSTQVIAAVIAGLIALVLLAVQLVADRKRKEAGSGTAENRELPQEATEAD